MYGSAFNMLMANSKVVEPEIGMGATLLLYSDRYPYTIVGISYYRSGPKKGEVKSVIAKEDVAIPLHKDRTESQKWDIKDNPNAQYKVFTKRKDGTFQMQGTNLQLAIGFRDKYYDYSF